MLDATRRCKKVQTNQDDDEDAGWEPWNKDLMETMEQRRVHSSKFAREQLTHKLCWINIKKAIRGAWGYGGEQEQSTRSTLHIQVISAGASFSNEGIIKLNCSQQCSLGALHSHWLRADRRSVSVKAAKKMMGLGSRRKM